jgi:hypothetical protein
MAKEKKSNFPPKDALHFFKDGVEYKRIYDGKMGNTTVKRISDGKKFETTYDKIKMYLK